jgi:hypothetical protein
VNESINISYFGNDLDFYHSLKIYCDGKKEMGEFFISTALYQKGKLVETCATEFPHIVFVDFTAMDPTSFELEELIFVKKTKKFRKTLFVALWSDRDEMKKHKELSISGFQLFYVKGNETDSLFRDAFYLAFNEILSFPRFAKAEKINKKTEVTMVSELQCMEKNKFWISTDIETDHKVFQMEHPAFPDLSTDEFTVLNSFVIPSLFPMTMSYCLKLPVAGPWDDFTSDTLQADTVETWFELNQDQLRRRPEVVKIITSDYKLYLDVFREFNQGVVNFNFSETVEIDELTKEFSWQKPPIIFLNTESDLVEGNPFDSLQKIVQVILDTPNYRPIVVACNTASKTAAIQKLFNYSKIICTENKLDDKTLFTLINSFLDKKKHEGEADSLFFPAGDPRRILSIPLEIEITSLTEHEITFTSSSNLPLYAMVDFKLPVDFCAITVPPIEELPYVKDKTHYMAFINGIGADELKVLRKFVNQIIYTPLKDFTPQSIAKVLSIMETVEKVEGSPVEEQQQRSHEEIKVSRLENHFLKTYAGKSKL